MRQAVRLRIYAEWRQASATWVASSPDIAGLDAEAETLPALEIRLQRILPELLRSRGIQGEAALIVDSAA